MDTNLQAIETEFTRNMHEKMYDVCDAETGRVYLEDRNLVTIFAWLEDNKHLRLLDGDEAREEAGSCWNAETVWVKDTKDGPGACKFFGR